MSSLFGSSPAAPTPPPAVDYVNTRDEVTGTQSNYVTNPDGTKTLVTSALPLTAEQQAYQDKLKDIESQSLDYINKLTNNFDPSQIPWLQQYLDDYQKTQTTGANQALADRTTQEEDALARYGQADSSAGTALRDVRGKDYADSIQQVSRDMSGIKAQAQQTALSNATNLYSLATGRLDTQLSQMLQGINSGQNFQLADAGLQQNRNLAIYNGAIQQQQLAAQTKAQNFGNLASLASLATLAAGPMGFGVIGAKGGLAALAAGAAK